MKSNATQQRKQYGTLFRVQPNGKPGAYIRRASLSERDLLAAVYGGAARTMMVPFRGQLVLALWLSEKDTTRHIRSLG